MLGKMPLPSKILTFTKNLLDIISLIMIMITGKTVIKYHPTMIIIKIIFNSKINSYVY